MIRKLTTIFAMDLVGYSSLMEQNEVLTLEQLNGAREAIIHPAIERHSGRIVKLMGDGTLAEFSSVVCAVECAVEIQRQLATRNSSGNGVMQLKFRIGIHLGDIIVESDDIFGDGVNIASRLETIASPGGIVVSKQVFDHIGGSLPVNLVSMGPQKVRNISRPIEVYSVELEPEERGRNLIRFGSFVLDPDQFELRQNGDVVSVEPRVFDLMVLLAKNRDRVVTKEEIFSEVWSNRIVSESALSSQIKMARKVLGDNGTAQHTIRTIHGRGFRFVAETVSTAEETASSAQKPNSNDKLALISGKPTVAVLPFANLNNEPNEDYFADGITEDITTALSKHRWLLVAARNSAFSFRNTNDSIRTVGQKLDANYIVTGSVRKAGQRARISVQLVDADTEQCVWSERFDRDMVDIFELQDEITELVAGRIESELGISEQRKAEQRPRKNLGAWDLYQLASAEFYKFTPQSNGRCQDLLRKSIELDPDFAGAHSRLAYAIVLNMVYFDAAPETEAMDEALAAAKRAIELDDQDANSYFTIGRVYLARREYDLAIDALEYAVDLNPFLAVTYCGLGDSLAYEGRLDEAIEQFEMAIKLSPHDPFRWAFYSYRALAHLFREEFEDAVLWARKSVQTPNSQYWARAHLVAAVGHLGDAEQAERATKDLLKVKPEFSVDFAKEHLFYLKRQDQLDMYLQGLRNAGLR